MDYTKRKELIEFLKQWESNGIVYQWHFEGVDIWPIVKSAVFFLNYEKKTNSSRISKLKKILKVFRLDFLIGFFFFKSNNLLTQKSVLFVGYSTFRTVFESSFINKFFKPLIDYIEKADVSYVVADIDGKKKKHNYKEEQLIFNRLSQRHYFRYRIKFGQDELKELTGFEGFIDELKVTHHFNSLALKEFIVNEIKSTLSWRLTWDAILAKIKPKKVFVLYYYCPSIYALINVCKMRNVEVIDMQHGGQGQFHIGYNYVNLPKDGLNTLPSSFWVWDRSSKNQLNYMIKGSNINLIFGGNPWIDYLKTFKNINLGDWSHGKKVSILYTLQPILDPILHPYIINAIRNTTTNYEWWLRTHPRMRPEQIIDLHQIIEKNGLKCKVIVDAISNEPLPIILTKTNIHVSHYSGAVVEAALFRIPVNIVIGDVGKEFFGELIENGMAQFFNEKNNDCLFEFLDKQYKISEKNAKNQEFITNQSYIDVLPALLK
ncbi:hypothetical protein [Leeuwenhoekiella sp. W20_SRS_FM14]|uniref:hypothetical protein n=1 Tax=Leeuwenhoekiella sp. W20_SRS_FM14 TaxID=3240270 RepID=UPI003F97830B